MKLKRATFLTLKLFLFWSTTVSNINTYSQTKEEIDSLGLLISLSEDTSKIDPLYDMAMLFFVHNDYQESLKYAKEILNLSDSLSFDYGKSAGLNVVAINLAMKNRLEKAIKYINLSYSFTQKNHSVKMNDLRAKILGDMANIYNRNNQPKAAIRTFLRCLELYETRGHIEGKGVILSNIGSLYRKTRDYRSALRYNFAAKKELEKLPPLVALAGVVSNIGDLYSKLNNYDSALIFLDSAETLCKQLNYNYGTGRSSYTRGEIYLEYFKKDSTHYKEALKNLDSALIIGQQVNDKYLISNSLNLKSDLAFYNKDYPKSIELALKSIKVGSSINRPILVVNNYHNLYLSYEAQNKTRKALEYYKLFTTLSDSLKNENNIKDLIKLKSEFKLEEKEKDIIILKKDKELEIKKRKISILLYSLLLIILSITSILLFRLRKRKYESELNALRQLKLEKESSSIENEINSIPIKFGKKIIPKKLDEIVYFNSESRYVFLNDTDGKKFVVDNNMKTLEKILPKKFIRVHNSYIINTNEIKEITKSYNGKVLFQLNNYAGTQIPSGLKYADNIKKIKELS